MRDFDALLRDWKDTLRTRGHSSDLVWLPSEAMIFRGRVYLRPVIPPLADAQVRNAFVLLPYTEAGAFMLVTSARCSYVTLLMDPFGSDSDVFLEQDNFYFCADPYVQDLQFVTSGVRWFWLKLLQYLSPQLSSLDYAFSIRQTREA